MNAFDQAKDRLWAIFNASVAYRDPAEHRTLTVGGKKLSNARFIEHDVRSEEQWRAVIERIRSECGRLDILVNNAGVVNFGSIEDCTLESFRFVNSVMSEGTFLGCHTAIPLMKAGGGGSIINMVSIAGIKGVSQIPGYCAAKGAIHALTRCVAVHCREQGNGIRCNTIVAG
jgi:3(or 17)beta-hydroxysteroid dehydrogenase